MKIKKGDNIIIIAGKDRGKKGKVVKSMPKDSKVVVEGLNMVKRHKKARKAGTKGQTVSVAMPINVSNVMVVDPKDGTQTRVGKKLSGGRFVRVTKKSGSEI
ncbi:MAG: 50S ribosomal protein L24 [Candidatus Paceibacterota bacterium]|jgi:large subunit ribosomal protein L24